MADPGARDLERGDPRPRPTDLEPGDGTLRLGDELRPTVAGRPSATGTRLAIGTAMVAGLGVFVWLSAHRADRAHNAAADALLAPSSGAVTSLPPPPELAAAEAASRNRVVVAPATPPPTISLVAPVPLQGGAPPRPILPGAIGSTPQLDPTARRKAPALVIDLAEAPAAAGAATAAQSGAAAAAANQARTARLNGDEQFAERVGAAEPDRANATMLRNPKSTVAQGVMIPAVLETALNSDLPGFTRAVVSRDVRGFDGSTVLIPRGSRVIGEYRSGMAQGASRAFIIWTRLLRPDGASVQIGSSGADPLGRAGLAGQVDRHFLERFGGAILLSVINGGVAALSRNSSTQVVIGSSSEATGLAATVAQPTVISPTIKVPQGSPIRIFVARDLDFSPVQGAAH